MNTVENMEKQILAFPTFWEFIAFIMGAQTADPIDGEAFTDSGELPNWTTLYNTARNSPEVQAHIEELCEKRTDRS